MIEINLLPGTGKKARSRSAGANLGTALSGAVAQVKDPYLIGAIAAVVIAASAVGGMWWLQQAKDRSLEAELRTAAQDSLQYAGLVKQKRRAEARRDSVIRQVDLIRSFDDKRFVWPHIMDEVSRALPPLTWLTSITQTNVTTISAGPPLGAKDAKAGDKKDQKPGAGVQPDTTVQENVRFRIVGNTVDIQALTRFMKLLEASPFVENVQLVKSSLVIVDGKELTEFQLDASYQKPDPLSIRTVPVALSVR